METPFTRIPITTETITNPNLNLNYLSPSLRFLKTKMEKKSSTLDNQWQLPGLLTTLSILSTLNIKR
jgi:hypothetical protein